MEKAGEIIDNIDTLTISVIQDDPEGEDQLNFAEEFLHMRGKETPLVTFRLLGTIDQKRVEWIEAIRASFSRVLICKRMLHDPMGSFNYERETVKPEHGVCLEMLHKLAIDRYGNVSPCVRHDPRGENRLWPDKKRIQKTNYLSDFWDGENRRQRAGKKGASVMDLNLRGKIAIVTGAGRGIGRAIALAFAEEGACVVVDDIDLSVAEEVAREIRSRGSRALDP